MAKNSRVLGRITKKYWTTPNKYVKLIEEEKKIGKRKNIVQTVYKYEDLCSFAPYVEKTAENILKYNPTALVAVDKRGILATRLVQHYIRRKLGKNYKNLPVYIINPGSRVFVPPKKIRSGPVRLINPDLERRILKERKIAIIDELAETHETLNIVSDFLINKKVKGEMEFFPLIDENKDLKVNLWESDYCISPTHDTKEDSIIRLKEDKGIKRQGRRKRYANYLILRDVLDDYMNKEKIGKDTRRKQSTSSL